MHTHVRGAAGSANTLSRRKGRIERPRGGVMLCRLEILSAFLLRFTLCTLQGFMSFQTFERGLFCFSHLFCKKERNSVCALYCVSGAIPVGPQADSRITAQLALSLSFSMILWTKVTCHIILTDEEKAQSQRTGHDSMTACERDSLASEATGKQKHVTKVKQVLRLTLRSRRSGSEPSPSS
jgi:hypothetical protein